jgi:3-hydroxyisobutyrate dehydrogenase
MRVAVLGTGIMGAGMARALLHDGHQVTVWNRSAERARPLADEGAVLAPDPGQAVAEAEVMITMLFDADAVADVAAQASPSLPRGAVWLQMATVGPDAARRLAEQAERDEVAYLDAPVVGTRQPAEQGTLTALVSGPAELIDRVRPVLESLTTKIVDAGRSAGQASALKLVCNAWLGLLTAGTAQSLALAERAGLDPALFLQVIKDAPVDSPYAQLKGPMMIDDRYDPPAFAVDGVLKDLRLIGDLARSCELPTTLLDAVTELFAGASRTGHGNQDMAAVRSQF